MRASAYLADGAATVGHEVRVEAGILGLRFRVVAHHVSALLPQPAEGGREGERGRDEAGRG